MHFEKGWHPAKIETPRRKKALGTMFGRRGSLTQAVGMAWPTNRYSVKQEQKKASPPPKGNQLTTYIDDRPLVSSGDHSARDNLRHEIRGDALEPEPPCAPVIEITGLELLLSTASGTGGLPSSPEEDDSYDSYAKDSVACAKHRLSQQYGTMLGHLETKTRRVYGRRLSNCSSIGEDDSEVLLQNQQRRGSMGSFANDSMYRGGKTLRSFESSFNDSSYGPGRRRNSIESGESSYHRRSSQHQRRLSVNTITSFTNDSSYDHKLRLTRRGSMDSYANDSVFGNNNNNNPKQQQFQYKPKFLRRGSMESYANDSVFGNHRSSSSSHHQW